jgi:hypothetical protein
VIATPGSQHNGSSSVDIIHLLREIASKALLPISLEVAMTKCMAVIAEQHFKWIRFDKFFLSMQCHSHVFPQGMVVILP